MQWKEISSSTDLEQIRNDSNQKPVVIFKNSNRCSISYAALSDFERDYKSSAPINADFYILDVVAHRPVSMEAADFFAVTHQSPQILLIKNGKCIYHNSHFGINLKDIREKVDEKLV
ncbi:MAG: bacillithiol system redox-active protein YtxJ [Cyclobacteriaceae bacterium]